MSVSKSFAVPSLLMADSSSSEGEEAQSFSQEEYESEDVMDETVYKPPLSKIIGPNEKCANLSSW